VPANEEVIMRPLRTASRFRAAIDYGVNLRLSSTGETGVGFVFTEPLAVDVDAEGRLVLSKPIVACLEGGSAGRKARSTPETSMVDVHRRMRTENLPRQRTVVRFDLRGMPASAGANSHLVARARCGRS
jgi:hypothetical protein